MKRILIFSLTYYPTRVGGAEVAIQQITNRISPAEITFDMVTLGIDRSLPRVEQIGNITVHRIGPYADIRELSGRAPLSIQLAKGLFPITAFLKAFSLHRKYRYDGVWAMMAAYAGFAALFFKLVHPQIPYLLTLQEGDPIPHILKKVRLVRPLFNLVFTKADRVQTISHYLAAWARRMRYRGPLTIIPNAVDTAHFSQYYTPERIAETRKSLGIQEGEVVLITTSRLVTKNALDEVIVALSSLPKHVRFIIFGTGPDQASLQKLADKLGVASRVEFKGQIGHDVLPLYLKACDIFIRPSRSEGMGNSFVEAMAAEVPVIATQQGGIADFLFDEKRNLDTPPTGWAVDMNAPEQIVEAVTDIISRSDKVAVVTRNAKKLAFEKYDWNLIGKDMKALFMDLLVNAVK